MTQQPLPRLISFFHHQDCDSFIDPDSWNKLQHCCHQWSTWSTQHWCAIIDPLCQPNGHSRYWSRFSNVSSIRPILCCGLAWIIVRKLWSLPAVTVDQYQEVLLRISSHNLRVDDMFGMIILSINVLLKVRNHFKRFRNDPSRFTAYKIDSSQVLTHQAPAA